MALIKIVFMVVWAVQSDRSLDDMELDELPTLEHMVLVDAGSTRTKLTSVNENGDMTSLKVVTHCTTDANAYALEGVAALAYQPLDICKPEVACLCSEDRQQCEQLKTAGRFPAFMTSGDQVSMKVPQESNRDLTSVFLLRALHALAMTNGETEPVNAKTVPIMGTAGMRHLSKETNEVIWDSLCGARDPISGFAFANKSKLCGTIPGTVEAYYEFLSHVAGGQSSKLMGTFTLGGVSAQIAVPLAGQDVQGWQELMSEVKDIFGDCSTLKGRHSKPLAFFKGSAENTEIHCYKDFIDIVPMGEAKLPDHIKAKLSDNFDDLRGIGVISFLGVGHDNGGRMGIAGGVESIEAWAQENNCGANENSDKFNIDRCEEEFFKALDEKDAFFKKVVHYFRQSKLSIHDFAYTTPAAIPSMAITDRDVAGDQVMEEKVEEVKEQQDAGSPRVGNFLLDAIETECGGARKRRMFGYNSSNTCMKALFTAKYIQWFFDNPVHMNDTLQFSPEQWTLGEYAEIAAQQIKSLREQKTDENKIDENQSGEVQPQKTDEDKSGEVQPHTQSEEAKPQPPLALLETAKTRQAKLLAMEIAWQAHGGYQLGAMLHHMS